MQRDVFALHFPLYKGANKLTKTLFVAIIYNDIVEFC